MRVSSTKTFQLAGMAAVRGAQMERNPTARGMATLQHHRVRASILPLGVQARGKRN